MKNLITIVFVISFSLNTTAQQTVVTAGKIEFEKKENLYKMLENSWFYDEQSDNTWINEQKKSLPQFKNTYFNLWFNTDKSLYKSGRENDQKIPDWVAETISENVIYNDIAAQLTTSQKTFFNNTVLFTDSTRHIDWRITNEVRTIAGFECRKATAVILDSVYVIAFYTNQILVSSGPESFAGLPGMILGIAIPRINTTWFATKLELTPVTPAELAMPVKGKKMTPADYKKKLEETMKNWGKWGKRNLMLVSI